MKLPHFSNRSELFEFFRENKAALYAEKAYQPKFGDSLDVSLLLIDDKGDVTKAVANPKLLDLDSFKVSVAINTTNIRDSHGDVHLPGLWKKSLKETKNLYLLQEHMLSFKGIISDKVNAFTKMMSWKDLGFNYTGETEVLIFNAEIEKARNEYMAEQYAKGYVKNHSVGMRYVKLFLALNSESKFDREEKAIWDKYIDQVVNREECEEEGYFWAVTEAKLIEGSAVPLGSNFATPPLSIEPSSGTQQLQSKSEPSTDTPSLIEKLGLITLSN